MRTVSIHISLFHSFVCSIFILIMGVAVPKMLSNEQKKAMNAQRAHETYGFLKDPRSNPYADKEEEE